jgi:glycosyltransferase involved in cell wall biosynthesis
MSLSIIIPTFNNVNYLGELLESILNNESTYDYEVLIGIDNCEETLDYFKHRNYPSNFFFYYFVENYGPYIIKNTLAELSNYEKVNQIFNGQTHVGKTRQVNNNINERPTGNAQMIQKLMGKRRGR